MVRGLGVSHKSLVVHDVTEGGYAIRFEHEDYLTKDFDISVGSELPTTFTEAMTKENYSMTYSLPNGSFLANSTIRAGEKVLYNGIDMTNNGNVPCYTWRAIVNTALGIDNRHIWSTTRLDPGETQRSGPPADVITPVKGTYNITLQVGPSPTGEWVDILPPTVTIIEELTILEWKRDVTFIATAPGISDLHGVEVFIDGISMGTT